jgi:hypothetical protein
MDWPYQIRLGYFLYMYCVCDYGLSLQKETEIIYNTVISIIFGFQHENYRCVSNSIKSLSMYFWHQSCNKVSSHQQYKMIYYLHKKNKTNENWFLINNLFNTPKMKHTQHTSSFWYEAMNFNWNGMYVTVFLYREKELLAFNYHQLNVILATSCHNYFHWKI